MMCLPGCVFLAALSPVCQTRLLVFLAEGEINLRDVSLFSGGGGGTILGEGHNFFPSCLGKGHNFSQGFLGKGHNFLKVFLLRK